MASVSRNINKRVAGMRGVHAAVMDLAHDIGGEAEVLLSEHFHSGDARIEVNRAGRYDAVVELVDEAALSIEFGRGPNENGQGAMEGLHILGKAANL